MSGAQEVPAVRQGFERRIADLVGRLITGVRYWDVHNFADDPRIWDYGDWHHAVMGVELKTDAGPGSILLTRNFFPYGVEVFDEPIEQHLRLGPQAPEGWTVSGPSPVVGAAGSTGRGDQHLLGAVRRRSGTTGRRHRRSSTGES